MKPSTQRTKHVLFVSEYYPPVIHGGGEINLRLVAEALAEAGVRVTVLTSLFSGVAPEETVGRVRILRRLRTGRYVDRFFDNVRRTLYFERSVVRVVRELLTKEKIDVIHLIGSSLGCARKLRHFLIPMFATIESYIALCPKGDFLCGDRVDVSRWGFLRYAGCMMRSREIGKMRVPWFLRYNPLFWMVTYARFRHLERNLRYVRLVAISEFVGKILKRHYGRESTVIPNFIDVGAFLMKRVRQKKPTIVYLGALVAHKGPQIILDAVAGFDCRVEFYGDGPLKAQLVQKMKELEINGEVRAPVPYDRVPEIYARADVVVFPSLWPEPFGRIAIEALAAGVPVIGSAIGGIEETIPPGTGMLVEPGNAGKLREALTLLLANPDWRARRARTGQELVKRRYSREAVVKKYLTLYGVKI